MVILSETGYAAGWVSWVRRGNRLRFLAQIAQDFIDAIMASPDDDSLRLKYAAWLDSQGDVLGEIIRVQMELAPLEEAGVASDEPHRLALSRRKWELFSQLQPTSAAVLPGGGFAAAYDRGLPFWVEMTVDELVQVADELFRRAPITVVRITKLKPDQMPRLAALPQLAKISRLILDSQPVGDAGMMALMHSPHATGLEWLELGASGLTSEGVAALAQSPLVKNLAHLQLYENALGDAGAMALANSSILTRLKVLMLHRCLIGPTGAVALASSPLLATVRDLRLGGDKGHRGEGPPPNCIGDAGACALAESCHVSAMENLDLAKNQIGNAGALALANSKSMPALTYLDLASNLIGDSGALAIAATSQLGALRYLYIQKNRFSDAALMALADTPNLPALKYMSLIPDPEYEAHIATDWDGTEVGGYTVKKPQPKIYDEYRNREGRFKIA